MDKVYLLFSKLSVFNFYGVGKKLFEGLLLAFGEPYGGHDSYPAFAFSVVNQDGEIFFVSHYSEKLLLHVSVGKMGGVVRVSIQRHLDVFDAVTSGPGYFLVIPVLFAMLGR